MSTLNFLTDEELAEKFKQEHSEQFLVLVRMHLSFVLDLNTDENECLSEKSKLKKWNLAPFMKKSKHKHNAEGLQLTPELVSNFHVLIDYLKQEQNIKIEGIFRRTGSLARQQELRNVLSHGKPNLDEGNFSVHDCASVLKGFLAELPDPLLTEIHFPAYCQIAELCGIIEEPTREDKLLEALQLLLLLLPTDNKVLLKDILELLNFTTTHEDHNRMSADNLATLFTPHLLCPRKLSPEQLHTNSQTLCGIISFMIRHSSELFKIPLKLAIDFRARYDKRMLSDNRQMDESVSDQYAAKTVFTFVDHERTAKENESNPTETALAQLYAHIQSLPESSKKRKLVKQFNKENGHGTPLQVMRSGHPKNKSFGDSIKKHIFSKKLARSVKHAAEVARIKPPEDTVTETMMTPRSRKPVLLVSGTNINALSHTHMEHYECAMDNVTEESSERLAPDPGSLKKSKSEGDVITHRPKEPVLNSTDTPSSLTSTFREYLTNRSMLVTSPDDSSFSSRTDDFNSNDFNDLSDSKLSESLLHCLNGNDPTAKEDCDDQKVLVLKPKKFDENGQPIVFETSF